MSRMPPRVLSSFALLARQDERFLLGTDRVAAAGGFQLLELLQPLKPLVHGLEVGERAAEPAVVDVRHADADRLLLRSPAACRFVPTNRIVPPRATVSLTNWYARVEVAARLVEVDDVDAVALAVDERPHLRVPALGLVAEVDAGVQQLAHGDDHVPAPFRLSGCCALAGWRRCPDALTDPHPGISGDRCGPTRPPAGEGRALVSRPLDSSAGLLFGSPCKTDS